MPLNDLFDDALEDFYSPIMKDTRRKIREFKADHWRDCIKFDMYFLILDAFYRLARYEHYQVKGKVIDKLVAGEMLREDIRGILKLQGKFIAMRNPKKLSISDEEVNRARSYPIENLVQFKGDFANCPFHGDKDPSMHRIDNRVHCFSCHKTWDTIAYVRELEGFNFGEAVRHINRMEA